MRLAGFALILALAAASAAHAQARDPSLALPPSTENPFVASRGTGPAPPAETHRTGRAPPEGAGPGGINFGRWRNANPATYSPAFADQMAQRFASLDRAAARADLERNGFTCTDRPTALDCRIEIMEEGCAKDWYVALDDRRPRPYAGFDVMCLGARE